MGVLLHHEVTPSTPCLNCVWLQPVLSQEKADNELLCSICVDLVTDLDEFITDDKTEQQIVEFVEQICHALGAISKDLEATCIALVESQLPAIIDGLVNDQLNPQEVCDFIKACP